MLYVLYSIHAEKGNEILMIGDLSFRVRGSGFEVQGSRFRVRGSGFNGFRWRLRRILADGIPISSAFPDGEGLGGATLRVDFYKGLCPKAGG